MKNFITFLTIVLLASKSFGQLGGKRPGSLSQPQLPSAAPPSLTDYLGSSDIGLKYMEITGETPPLLSNLMAFSTQVVSGVNYFVKVRISRGKYLHLRIYEPLPYTGDPIELKAVQMGKRRSDKIEYF